MDGLQPTQSLGEMVQENINPLDQQPDKLEAISQQISSGINKSAEAGLTQADSVQIPQPTPLEAPQAQAYDLHGFDIAQSQQALAGLLPQPQEQSQQMPMDPAAPPNSLGSYVLENIQRIMGGSDDRKQPKAPHPDDYEHSARQARAEVSQSMTGQGWKLDKPTLIKSLTPFYEGKRDLSQLAPPALSATYDFVAQAQQAGYKPIITSGFREGDKGYHGYGEGVDVVLLDKNGKEVHKDKETKLIKKWARQAGWATVLDEANHPIPGHTTGAHYHLAWGTDGVGLAGAHQLISRKPGDPNYLKPSSGQPVNFRDAMYLVNKADIKTIPGKAARAAQLYGLDPDLFTRQIQAESGFKDVVNPESGARGWAQFMPATGAEVAKEMGVDIDRFYSNPMIHLKGAAYYLGKKLAPQFNGNIAQATAAYNWGPGNMQDFMKGKANLPAETREYVYKIFKDRYPEDLPNSAAVDNFLRSGKGPKMGELPTQTEKQQFAQSTAHPAQKFLSYLFHPEEALPEGNTKAAIQTFTGFKMDTEKGEVEMGMPAVVKDSLGTFINTFLWGMTDVRSSNLAKYDQVMTDFKAEHPWAGSLDFFGRHGVPMLAGIIGSTEALLAGGGFLPGAAGTFFKGSKTASHFFKGFQAAEAKGLSGALGGFKSWLTANGGASKLLSSTFPLAAVIGLDSAGRTAVAMEKSGKYEAPEIFKESMKQFAIGSLITTAFNTLLPLGGQVVLGSMVKSPEAIGAMGQIYAQSSPAQQKVMKLAGGGVAGAMAAPITNFAGSLFGEELDISPQMGAGLGIVSAFAGRPAIQGMAKLVGAFEESNPAVYNKISKMWDKTWESLEKTYEETATDEILANAKEVSHKFAEAEANLAKAKHWEEINRAEAEKRIPGVEVMEGQQKLLHEQTKMVGGQKALIEQELNAMDQQLQGSPLPQLYEQALAFNKQYPAELKNLDAQLKQQAGTPMEQALTQQKKQLQDTFKEAQKTIKEITEKNPEVIRISDLKEKLKVMSGAEAEAMAKAAEYDSVVGPVLKVERRWAEAQMAEAETLAKLPDEVKADSSFNLAHQSKVLEFKYAPGEVPNIAGIGEDTVAQLASEDLNQSLKSIMNRLHTEGDRIWDQEYNLKGVQVARNVATKEGSTHDVFVANKFLEYNKIANSATDDLGKVVYGKRNMGYYSRQTDQFKELLGPQTLQWSEKGFKRSAGARGKAGKVQEQTVITRSSYLLKAAEEAGYNLDEMRKDIATTRSKGMKSYLDVETVTAEGKAVKRKNGKEVQGFEPSPDLVRQALAADSVGDNWVPINFAAGDKEAVTGYLKYLREEELNGIKKLNAEMAKDVLGYASTRQEQVILKGLYGEGDKVISEPLHPLEMEEAVVKRVGFQGPRQASAEDHAVEMQDWLAKQIAKDPVNMKQAMIGALSEEMQLLSKLGEGLAGGNAKAQGIPLSELVAGKPQQGLPIAMTPDGARQYVQSIGKDGKATVEIATRKTVAAGADVTKIAMGLEGWKPSSSVSSMLDVIKGHSALSEQNGRLVFTERVNNWLKSLEKAPEAMSDVEIKGAVGQFFAETQFKAKQVADELSLDMETAVDGPKGAMVESYNKLPEGVKEKHTPEVFTRDVVDTLEDPSLTSQLFNKYGDSARQAVTDLLELRKALDQVRTSSPWADKTARSTYFLHQWPSLQAHAKAMYGDAADAGLSISSAMEGARRQFDTVKQVRDFAEASEAQLTGLGIDPKEFINMTPATRVEKFFGSKMDITKLSREQMERREAETNKMAMAIIMKPDTMNIKPGQLLANKMKSIYHQEGTRQMLELMMRSKTLGTVGKGGDPATILYHAKDSNTSRVVETPSGPQAYKRLNQSAMFGSSEVTLFGEKYNTGDLMIHPEAFDKLNNYAGSARTPQAWKNLKDVVNFVNQTNLLGGIPAHLFQTTAAVMGETLAGFYAAAGKMVNLTGAGRRIRRQGVAGTDGRLYELYAIRHGLNAKSLANSSFDIAEGALSSLGEDFAAKVMGVGDSNLTKLFQTLDMRNPNHALARKHLKGLWGAASDFMNTPIQMEQALQRHLTFQSIRDAQVAAFYARAGHFINSVPELAKIPDASARLSAALNASAEVANQQAGSIPYHRMHKFLREGAQVGQITPGWFMTQANAVAETMQALGYWALGPLRTISPDTAVRLRKLGHKFNIGKRHPDLPPEVAGAVRERIVRNIAGLGLASFLFTETFNMFMNGRTSYQEADANSYGKLVVGNSTYTVPFFGYVRRLLRLTHKGAGSAIGTTDDTPLQIIGDELLNSLSPFVSNLAPILQDSTQKEKLQGAMESEATMFAGVPVLGGMEQAGKQLLGGVNKTLGLNELVGYKPEAGIGDVLGLTGDQSKAAQLPPSEYVGRQSGFYRSTPKVPRNIMAVGSAKESHYRNLATQKVVQYLDAAKDAEGNPDKQKRFMELADKARNQGVPIHDSEVIKANGGVKTYYLSEEAYDNLWLRYTNPGESMRSASGISRGVVNQRLDRYNNTSVDPYEALIKMDNLDEATEEEE